MHTQSPDKPRTALVAQAGKYLSPELSLYAQVLAQRLTSLADGEAGQPAVGFTACGSGAGTTTLATALALVLAESGREVLLVDAAWHKPVLARQFGIAPVPGLWELMAGRVSPALAVTGTDVDHLHVLPCGRRPSGALPLCPQAVLADQLRQFKERFDWIVFDLPPAMPEEPLMAWTGVLDGVLLVIHSEQTVAEDAKHVRQALADCQARLLGAVLNKHRSYLPRWLI